MPKARSAGKSLGRLAETKSKKKKESEEESEEEEEEEEGDGDEIGSSDSEENSEDRLRQARENEKERALLSKFIDPDADDDAPVAEEDIDFEEEEEEESSNSSSISSSPLSSGSDDSSSDEKDKKKKRRKQKEKERKKKKKEQKEKKKLSESKKQGGQDKTKKKPEPPSVPAKKQPAEHNAIPPNNKRLRGQGPVPVAPLLPLPDPPKKKDKKKRDSKEIPLGAQEKDLASPRKKKARTEQPPSVPPPRDDAMDLEAPAAIADATDATFRAFVQARSARAYARLGPAAKGLISPEKAEAIAQAAFSITLARVRSVVVTNSPTRLFSMLQRVFLKVDRPKASALLPPSKSVVDLATWAAEMDKQNESKRPEYAYNYLSELLDHAPANALHLLDPGAHPLLKFRALSPLFAYGLTFPAAVPVGDHVHTPLSFFEGNKLPGESAMFGSQRYALCLGGEYRVAQFDSRWDSTIKLADVVNNRLPPPSPGLMPPPPPVADPPFKFNLKSPPAKAAPVVVTKPVSPAPAPVPAPVPSPTPRSTPAPIVPPSPKSARRGPLFPDVPSDGYDKVHGLMRLQGPTGPSQYLVMRGLFGQLVEAAFELHDLEWQQFMMRTPSEIPKFFEKTDIWKVMVSAENLQQMAQEITAGMADSDQLSKSFTYWFIHAGWFISELFLLDEPDKSKPDWTPFKSSKFFVEKNKALDDHDLRDLEAFMAGFYPDPAPAPIVVLPELGGALDVNVAQKLLNYHSKRTWGTYFAPLKEKFAAKLVEADKNEVNCFDLVEEYWQLLCTRYNHTAVKNTDYGTFYLMLTNVILAFFNGKKPKFDAPNLYPITKYKF